MLMPKAALEGLDALGLEEEAADLFLRENARRVFRL
jgi:predicted TIM-barrel fold metal-dependent hydrolase